MIINQLFFFQNVNWGSILILQGTICVMFWTQVKKDGTMEVSQIDHSAVGHYISTKRMGSNDREDVTNLYKYPDGKALGGKEYYDGSA